MARELRVVHYLNQFFAGLGGEEHANLAVQVQEGAVGPGRALQVALASQGKVVATIVAGDNYVNEEREAARAAMRDALQQLKPDVVVAGPAFDAGRYGLACGELCALAGEMGVAAVTAMYPDNPGVISFRRQAVIVPTGTSPAEMAAIMRAVSRLAVKLGSGGELGPADEDGYLPSGLRRPGLREKPASQRAVDMLVAKATDRPFTTELPVVLPERIQPAPPIADLKRARLGLVTTGSLVPKGNPDRLVRGNANEWFRYSIKGLKTLDPQDWECIHRGFYISLVNQEPNYVLPLDEMRAAEAEGLFGELYPWFFATTGVGTAVGVSKRMGAEMAERFRADDVRGVVMVST